MSNQANLGSKSIPAHMGARLILGLLIASMLIAASWPAAWAQEATPEDAAQAEVAVADEPLATDVTDAPVAPEVTENQEVVEIPEPTPAPTVVPVNADFLQIVEIPASDVLVPGSAVEFIFEYQVTTPRSATTIIAEIGGGSGQNGAWTIQLQSGGVWSEADSRVLLSDTHYTSAGSAIPLSVFVIAPQNVVVEETITIWLSSSVARFDGGVEQGIVATQPLASARVVPPPPTPTPTNVPIVDPKLSCAGPADYAVQIGGELELKCEVTVLDSRAGATLVIEPPSGWTASSGDEPRSTERLELGPFALDDGTPTVHIVPITVQMPAVNGVEGILTVRLIQDSDAGTELDSMEIQMRTIIPDEWVLHCSAGSAAATPGTSAEISCELPEAAWAFRGNQPAYTSSTTDGWAGDVGGAVDKAAFSFSLGIPCSATNEDEPISVNVDLGNGMTFGTEVTLAIDQSMAAPVPVLSRTGIDFGDSQWLGTSYAPAETTVTLTISGATSACASAPWSIQLITSSFTNGEIEVDPTISFSTLESTGEPISPKPGGTVVPGAGRTVVSGTGDGVVVVDLALSLPATVGAGRFTGDVEFSISTGP